MVNLCSPHFELGLKAQGFVSFVTNNSFPEVELLSVLRVCSSRFNQEVQFSYGLCHEKTSLWGF